MSVNEPYEPGSDTDPLADEIRRNEAREKAAQADAEESKAKMSQIMLWLAAGFGGFVAFCLVMVVVLQVILPAEHAPWTKFKVAMATAEKEALDVYQSQKANYEGAIQLAVNEAELYKQAYSEAYSLYNEMRRAYMVVELELIDKQKEGLGKSTWVNLVGANVAELGCMLAPLSEDPASMMQACGAADMLRSRMLGVYNKHLPNHLTELAPELEAKLVHPKDIVSRDY
ncbi:MAG: hypothetical protein AAGA22_06330, partial [Pseudomonadota bacterium]